MGKQCDLHPDAGTDHIETEMLLKAFGVKEWA